MKKTRFLELPNEDNSFYDHYKFKQYELHPLLIFVFGSNLRGAHSLGAAKLALTDYHAVNGIPAGIQGGSYAIPTKNKLIKTLPLNSIKIHVDNFLEFNKNNPNIYFYITPIGTGLARYKHQDIAPMFKGVKRSWLPAIWKKYLEV